MPIIERVEVIDFKYDVKDMGSSFTNAHNHVGYVEGSTLSLSKYAIIVECDDGSRGEYVALWGGTRPALAQTLMLASDLPGRDADQREAFYTEWNRRLCHMDHMGQGPVDIVLWDLAGKQAGKSISRMIGQYRNKLPTYASTYHGDEGMLHSNKAFTDFALQCYEMGYRAFKHHGWFDGDARKEASLILALGETVGDKMKLMYDAASDLKTFADALYVGRACDDANFFWYEDPYRDNSLSAFSHKKLRSMIKTPLLITEHVRALEAKCDFIMAGGTDFVRVDPEYDMGITGALKTAHMAEAFGLDVEIHAPGPAHRQLMASIRNTNFYEMAEVGPKLSNILPPCYACGYKDELDSIDENGCVSVPDGPGLGVTYDWDWLNYHATNRFVFGKK
ncbi:enolase C-terminal domain-like protein [Trabulsiella odontotermitis]|uniref:enolase C-terminal domain-like protein n=1 Tax=Trabulsiella odontotermitis TaxID=379893 RepID=UPI000675D485|nr:enolase C-terminal domain-like protein [Trabulsiella odontotermitis]KNC91812.1 mandelate racemase [Trabulsiella odontotermitis]